MKQLFKQNHILVFISLMIFSSCALHKKSQTACPTFDTPKIKERHSFFKNMAKISRNKQIFNRKKSIHSLEPTLKHTEDLYSTSNKTDKNEPILMASDDKLISEIILENESKKEVISNDDNFEESIKKKYKNQYTKRMNLYQLSKKSSKKLIEKKMETKSKVTPKRKTAVTTGLSLLLMAVLAGVLVPVLGTLGASIGFTGILLLDIIVSLGIYKYHKQEKPKLAKTSTILRLLYSAILAVGVGFLFGRNLSIFNKVWGYGLIVFGAHLITLGKLFNNEGGKKWVNVAIKSLLIMAGIGYIIQYVGILFVSNPIGFAKLIETIFIPSMILGEVLYALWLLIKGGKKSNK